MIFTRRTYRVAIKRSLERENSCALNAYTESHSQQGGDSATSTSAPASTAPADYSNAKGENGNEREKHDRK